MKIYIDGCSLTYGQGLPREKSLATLFQTIGLHETVTDKSRPGKSNSAIVYDTWDNRSDFDVYILGFTFSNRIYLKYRELNLDFHSVSTFKVDYQSYYDSIIEQSCTDLHKQIYTLYDGAFYDKQSDILVDTILCKLLSEGKIVIPFSWQNRNTDYKLLYPVYGPEFRLSKNDYHLNEKGMRHLFDTLQLKLLEKRND